MSQFLLIAIGFLGIAGILASTFLVKCGFASIARLIATRVQRLKQRATGGGAQQPSRGE